MIEIDSSGLMYKLSKDGTVYTVIGTEPWLGTERVIPPIFNDKPVVGIGRNAFRGVYKLTNINIPESVTKIHSNAFRSCCNLTRIIIPNSVTSIGASALSGCKSLTAIIFEKGSQLKSIGDEAFFNCASLRNITIPSSVTKIGWGAFFGCTKLTDVDYSGSKKQWKKIAIDEYNDTLINARYKYAIEYDTDYDSFLDGLFSNDEDDFDLDDLLGDADDDSFLADLFSDDDIISDSSPNDALVPSVEDDKGDIDNDSATDDIANYDTIALEKLVHATKWDSSLFAIAIPSGVTHIQVGRYESYTNLISIIIPSSVVCIYANAFRDCINLVSVYYEGTVEQWNNIQINKGNEILKNVAIIFNYKPE